MREGAIAERKLPDGRVLNVYPQIFNWVLTISENATTPFVLDDY